MSVLAISAAVDTRIALGPGERALILPQGQAPQATRLVLSHGEVNIHSGARPEPGKVVVQYPGVMVTQQDGGGVTYVVSDETPFGLWVTSEAFHGYKQDRWFFRQANFRSDSERGVECLAGRSY